MISAPLDKISVALLLLLVLSGLALLVTEMIWGVQWHKVKRNEWMYAGVVIVWLIGLITFCLIFGVLK